MPEQHSWMDVERRSGTYQFGVEEGLAQGLARGREEGLERGREEGLEQGREEGLEQGLEQGRHQARAALIGLILDLLTDRGIAVDAAAEGRIRGCEDLATLQQWARRAAQAGSTIELFA